MFFAIVSVVAFTHAELYASKPFAINQRKDASRSGTALCGFLCNGITFWL